jgi:hypothetical protein
LRRRRHPGEHARQRKRGRSRFHGVTRDQHFSNPHRLDQLGAKALEFGVGYRA